MAYENTESLLDVVSKFVELTKCPDKYLSFQRLIGSDFLSITKTIYDHIKLQEKLDNVPENGSLPKLIIQNFDDEQVWQQIELQNVPVLDSLTQDVHVSVKNSEISIIENDKSHESCDNMNKSQVNSSVQKNTEKNNDRSRRKVSDLIANRRNKGNKLNTEKIDLLKSKKEINTKNKSKQHIADSDLSNAEDSDENDKLSDEDEHGKVQSDNVESETELTEIKSRIEAFENESNSDNDLDFDFDELDDEKDGGQTDDSKEDTESDDQSPEKTKKKKNTKPSIVDDQFFKLAEMEVFLDEQDQVEEYSEEMDKANDNDDEIDVYGNIDSDEDIRTEKSAREIKYKDYYIDNETRSYRRSKSENISETTNENTNTNDDKKSDSSEEEEDQDAVEVQDNHEPKSSFELRQEKLKQKIKELEKASLSQKEWQLSGETSAYKRPENSLLEETLQFEHTTRLPPVITEETTHHLESIIKQRIKDKSWDDVERKVKPTETVTEYKKRITLDQEKSKKSLGEIYEEEFLKLHENDETTEKKDPDHEKIKKSMRDLFIKLDALSNFHFTPKPALPELVIVSNQPSINMEEIAPVSVSDVQLLAPEEIHNKKKGELKSGSEKSKVDKNRERRNKKAEKRSKTKEKAKREKLVNKLNPGLGNKYSKERAMREIEKQSKADKSLTIVKEKRGQKSLKSRSFFSQLQDEVKTQTMKRKMAKSQSEQKTAKKFKL